MKKIILKSTDSTVHTKLNSPQKELNGMHSFFKTLVLYMC